MCEGNEGRFDQRPAEGAKFRVAEQQCEFFARRLDEERPAAVGPTTEAVADVRAFSLAPRHFTTQVGGLFLFVADLVRLVYYTTDVGGLLGAWDAVAGRLGETGLRPASTLVGVSALAFPELLVEIEATAVVTSPATR